MVHLDLVCAAGSYTAVSFLIGFGLVLGVLEKGTTEAHYTVCEILEHM